METRELYRQKYEAQLAEWSAKVAGLKARGEKLTAQARIDLQPRIDAAHTHMEAAQTRLHEMADATDETWEGVRAKAEKAWGELKGAVEGAYDAVTGASSDADRTPPPKGPAS